MGEGAAESWTGSGSLRIADQRKAREGSLTRGRCLGLRKPSYFMHFGGGEGLGRTGRVSRKAVGARAVTETPEVSGLRSAMRREHSSQGRTAPTEASACGMNRIVHRNAPGATSASVSVTTRSNGCTSLKCGIANVDQTYLWLCELGAERHGLKRGLARTGPRYP